MKLVVRVKSTLQSDHDNVIIQVVAGVLARLKCGLALPIADEGDTER